MYGGTAMKTILILDDMNYPPDLDEIYRVAVRGIIFVEGKLLMIESDSGELKLPGGGIDDGENDCQALVREVKEETGVDYEVDRLAVICENFFKEKNLGYDPLHCHVIEFYYLMKSRGKKDAKCGSIGWDNAKESIHWIPLDKLPETDVRPEFLRTRIKEILENKGVLHIVNDER